MKYLQFVLGLIIMLTYGCEKDKFRVSQPTEFDAWRDQIEEFVTFGDVKIVGPVAIRLSLLDKNLQPSSAFQEGENFVFSLAIINLTDSTFYLEPEDINTEDLFRVYKITDNWNGSYIGKPFYQYYNLGMYDVIRPGEVWDLRISWLKDITLDQFVDGGIDTYHNETTPLLRGKYKTWFISKFIFSDYRTISLGFNIEFDII